MSAEDNTNSKASVLCDKSVVMYMYTLKQFRALALRGVDFENYVSIMSQHGKKTS